MCVDECIQMCTQSCQCVAVKGWGTWVLVDVYVVMLICMSRLSWLPVVLHTTCFDVALNVKLMESQANVGKRSQSPATAMIVTFTSCCRAADVFAPLVQLLLFWLLMFVILKLLPLVLLLFLHQAR